MNTGYYFDKDYENRITVWGLEGWLRFGHTSVSLPLERSSSRAGAPKRAQTFAKPPEPDA